MKIWARWPYIHLSGYISLQNANQDRTLLRNQYY